MRLRSVLLFLGPALIFAQFLHASDKSQPSRDRLKVAAEVAALDGPDVHPWHWRVNLTFFDLDGKKSKAGTLEMWLSDKNMLTVFTLGADQMTVLRVGDTLYRTDGDPKAFAIAYFIQTQLLHPVPQEVYQPSTTHILSMEKAGHRELDWIAPSLVQPTNDTVAEGRQFSFCFASGTLKLLMTYEPGGFAVIRSQVGAFQSHEVPIDLEIYVGTTRIAEAKTDKLEATALAASIFEVKPEMKPFTESLELTSGDLIGMQLSQSGGYYPVEASDRHISGKLVFDAVIGKDGHILSFQSVGKSNPALVTAAKDAISRWIYRPYLINGLPFEVRTRIYFHFNLTRELN